MFALDSLEQYRRDPQPVDASWREYFDRLLGRPRSPADRCLNPPPASRGHGAAGGAAKPPLVRDGHARAPQEPPRPARERSKAMAVPAILPGDIAQPIRGGALRIAENMEASLGVPTATTQRQIPIKLARREPPAHQRAPRRARAAARSPSRTSWPGPIQALKTLPALNDAFDELERQAARASSATKSASASPSTCRRRTARGRCSCRTSRARSGWTSPSSSPPPTTSSARAQRQDQALRLRGHHDLADEPRHARHDGVRAAPDARPGRDHRDGRDRVSRAVPRDGARDAVAAGISKVMTFTSHLRPPHHPGRRIGRFPRAHRGAPARRARLLRAVFADLASRSRRYAGRSTRTRRCSADGHADDEIAKQARVLELINAYRVRGHLLADIDPLGRRIEHHPELDLETYGLTIWDLDREFWTERAERRATGCRCARSSP